MSAAPKPAMSAKPAGWLYTSPSGLTQYAAPLDQREQGLCDKGWTETPLYSADTIAALRKDALLLYGKVRHEFYRMGFPFMTEAEIDRRMAEQWPAAHASWMALKDAPVDAAIDAAQSTEGER